MSGVVHYEIYVFQNNSWDLLARYPSEQRADALEYAKSVERSEHRPTKVVRESYDLNTQTFHEALVYLSEIPKNRDKGVRGYAGNHSIPPLSVDKKKKKTNRDIAESITMLFLSMLFSVIMAGVITALILHLAARYDWLPPNLSQNFILSLFTFFFLVFSISTAAKWVNWGSFIQEIDIPKQITKSSKPFANTAPDFSNRDLYEMGRQREEAPPSLTSRILNNFFDAFDVLIGRKPSFQRKKEEEERKKAEEEKEEALQEINKPAEAPVEEEPEILLPEENEPEQEQDPLPQEAQEKQPDDATDAKEKSDKVVIPPELEKDYMKMTSFLSVILRVLQSNNTLLNTYNRFGIELFLAGACEQMSQSRKLSKAQNQLILSGLLTLLGRTKILADIFYFKLEEYTLEPKYLPMIESGAEGMRLYSATPSSPELVSLIQSAMENWQNPDQKEQSSSGICTIMFTDMVSSTHITQTLGDHMAQQLIRMHNAIVRKALSTCGGTEIKQTGDGIMASFKWASNAIDAAIAIQRAVSEYNRQTPTVPLEIRIGLNAGEPIVEDNDLFGATVQLASRVCGQAGANQIYVSAVIKELSAGKNYVFKPLGDFLLKGIDAPQPLYEVEWNRVEEILIEDEELTAFSKNEAKVPPKETKLAAALPEF